MTAGPRPCTCGHQPSSDSGVAVTVRRSPRVIRLLGQLARWPSKRITRGERRTVTATSESPTMVEQVQGRGRLRRVGGSCLQALAVVVAVYFCLWGADTLARMSAQTCWNETIQEATGVEGQSGSRGARSVLAATGDPRCLLPEVHVTTRGIRVGRCGSISVDSQLFDGSGAVPRCPRPLIRQFSHRSFGGEPPI